ncbi:MAG: hypothetical protein KF770_10675 [Anaerolineae bacterium]|nr:hypothetical protein [Anaerolineae bacterium]
MATLTIQQIGRAGVVPAPVAVAAGGDVFPNDGRTLIEVHNDHAADPRTVTIVTQVTVDGKAVADDAVTVTAAQDRKLIGPFPPEIYNDANGRVSLTYSDSGADMRVGVYRLGG